MKLRCVFALYVVSFMLTVPAIAEVPVSCHVGTYRLADGSMVDIGQSDGDTLRWRLLTGETGQLQKQINGIWTSTYGWTGRPDRKKISFSDCDQNKIVFGRQPGRRIPFLVSETNFESGGVRLVGRLIMPPGSGKVPVVVLIHGSEHTSGMDTLFLQRVFPSLGIGAFVFDKRGTGRSGGTYTQDYNLLASDAVNALAEARRLAGARLERVGYWGGSQGGWVVPLAANKASVDFAIVAYGLAVNVVEEDQEGVALDMRFHNHSAAETANALELAKTGEHVVATLGKDGYAQFDALRKKYESAPWYKDVHGDYLFMVLPLNQEQIVQTLKPFADTSFNYDPMPALRASRTPQLWILGGDDLDAPSAETSMRIKSLASQGKTFTLAVYPGAQHGMTLYELDPKGERVGTSYAPEYFHMMAEFIKSGRLGNHYPQAEITRPRSPSRGLSAVSLGYTSIWG